MNDYTYTVRTGGMVIAATGDLDLARAEAMKAAKAMTAKGGATGHVLIDYWTKGQVTDTEHVYDDGAVSDNTAPASSVVHIALEVDGAYEPTWGDVRIVLDLNMPADHKLPVAPLSGGGIRIRSNRGLSGSMTVTGPRA